MALVQRESERQPDDERVVGDDRQADTNQFEYDWSRSVQAEQCEWAWDQLYPVEWHVLIDYWLIDRVDRLSSQDHPPERVKNMNRSQSCWQINPIGVTLTMETLVIDVPVFRFCIFGMRDLDLIHSYPQIWRYPRLYLICKKARGVILSSLTRFGYLAWRYFILASMSTLPVEYCSITSVTS